MNSFFKNFFVAHCLTVCCGLVLAGSAEAQTFDDYNGKTVVLAAKRNNVMYAVTCNFPESGRMAKQEVTLNQEGNIVYLTSEAVHKEIQWTIGLNSKSKIIIGSVSSGKYLYINNSNNLTTEKSNYFTYSNTYKTFTYTPESSSSIYGIVLYGEKFALEDNTFFKTYPIAKPYFLAEHTWRTLGSSNFGTICFPKAVRADEVAGATFYEIYAKIMNGEEFKGIVLNEVTGDLKAGRPYIFKRAGEATYIVAAMHGDAAEAGNFGGLVGTLTGTEEDGGFIVPAGMYILQGDQLWLTTEGQSRLLAGRAYINPADITNIIAYSKASYVKGIIIGMDAPADEVSAPAIKGAQGATFDLQGRPATRLLHGHTYLIDGRKVYIK